MEPAIPSKRTKVVVIGAGAAGLGKISIIITIFIYLFISVSFMLIVCNFMGKFYIFDRDFDQ